MQRSRMAIISVFLVLFAIAVGCTGSGEGGSSNSGVRLSGLILPEKVSVVDPQTSGSSKPSAKTGASKVLAALIGSDVPADSDYAADTTTVYVNERSLEAFNMANEILCMVRQTRYDVMLNAGPYRAQLDTKLCSSKRGDASGSGESSVNQSSGSSAPEYEEWIVNSYRTSATAPHIVDFWVKSKDGPNGGPQTILARVTITEGADTAPPYGIFKVNFKAIDPNDPTKPTMKGFLNAERDPATGKVLLKMSQEDANSYYIQKATLDKSANNFGSGSVLTAMTFTWMTPTVERLNISYSDLFFRRDESGQPSICLDRKAFDVSAWKYGLYTAAAPIGTRVKVNAGFPITKDGNYGWIGYWGLWMPNNVVLNNGDQVMKHDYETNTDTPYTVLKAGGKLKIHKRHEVTLGDIKNVPLTWWDNGNTYQVAWNGSGIDKISQLISNQTWSALPAIPLNLADLSWPELGFWSQSLGGSVIIKFKAPLDRNLDSSPTSTLCGYKVSTNKYDCSAPAANNSVPVVYYSENIVYPDDGVPAQLKCFNNCPDVATLATSTNPYKNVINQQNVAPASATTVSYTFNPATMLLYDGATPVVLAAKNSNFSWGITSGALFDPAYLPLLACDWDPNSTCGWKAWSVLPEFYTWETGPDSWNQFTALKDLSGTIVKFEKPLQIKYVHHKPASGATLADIKYDNVTFLLEYNGFGNLNGIPGKCVSMDTGLDADCANGGNTVRWVPEFSIPDLDPSTASNLTEVYEVTDGGSPRTFIIKALEKEERMRGVALANCNALPTADYPLPSMSAFIDPVIGSEPATSGAPAVIGGVVQ